MYYINNFFIYSIFGYILESITLFLIKSKGTSGILYGPWTFIYGIGVVIIIILEKLVFSKKNWNKWLKRILLFIIVSIMLSFIEWIGGILIEKILHKTFWDYSNHLLNIGKYISVEMCLVWGTLSLLFIYLLKPITDKLIKKIPNFLTYILIVLMIVDFIFTLKKGL